MKIMEGFQKGVNLGGWISQFAKYDKKHFESFITKDDIRDIAQLGFDHVRLPVDYNVLEDEEGNLIEEGFGYVENCRSWCEEFGLNLLIDLHECYGYSFDPLKKDMDREVFFYDDALQARFMKLWKEIATRLSPYQKQVAFEPLNEVVLNEVADAWNQIAGRYIKMMREIVPDSYLVIGGVWYNNVMSVPKLDVPVDDKVVYNFHCYEPMIFSHQGAYWVEEMPADFRIGYPKTLEEYRKAGDSLAADLAGAIYTEGISEIGEGFFEDIFRPAIEKAEKDNVALYCGEYGVIDLADNDSRLRWLTDIHRAFKKYSIGHALWNYKEKDFGMVDESFAEIKDRFMEIV
ncbi:MAG: glycoside hydrolase family 5 protein [Lachnospiraceae bacterium]|nr:glycoside hydrolase family 5 protein [Lachnospiraceae bacterium]